jgi:hypothetical protein
VHAGSPGDKHLIQYSVSGRGFLLASMPGVHCVGTYGSYEEMFHVVHGRITRSLVGTYRIQMGAFLRLPAVSASGTGRRLNNMK